MSTSLHKTVLLGAGGLAKEIYFGFLKPLTNEEILVFDDNPLKNHFLQFEIQGPIPTKFEEHCSLYIGLSDPAQKKAIVSKITIGKNQKWPSHIHPSTIVYDHESVQTGEGVLISASCVLTHNIVLGNHTFVNLSCTIGHDVEIGAYCSIMPSVNISGQVIIEDSVFIGSGATILPGIKIGQGAIIGAGAVVNKNVNPKETVVGVPAAQLRKTNL